jgi:uncharacterized membrane protein YfcA
MLGSAAGAHFGVWLTTKIRSAYIRLVFAMTLFSAPGIALKFILM